MTRFAPLRERRGAWAPPGFPPVVATMVAAATLACGDPLGPLDELPRALTVAERSVISSANDFGLDLFARLVEAQRDENVFFSPLSAYMALGMTANGAANETLASMRATLRQADLSEEEVNRAYRGLLDLFLGLDPQVDLQIANSIWHRLELPVRPAFVEQSQRVFDASVRALDFDDPASVDVINAWVARRTRGRIDQLVERLKPRDVMLLINAMYFKGSWQHQFDPRQTRPDGFRLLDGTRIQVPMMTREGVKLLRYQQREEFEAAEFLYGRGAYVMTILLPPEGTAPADLLAGAGAAAWNLWMEGFEETSAIEEIRLPKFRLEWEKLLNDDLEAMGMAIAFDPGAADFDRLAEAGKGLFISEVKQKTFVEVNEEGTEAAAATSVVVAQRGRPTFRVDRPFLFAIRERFSGTILFIGQLLDPTA